MIIKKVITTLRKLMRRSISRLPAKTRHKIYRRMICFRYEPPEGVVFKLATTRDELEQAFKLLHDAYVASGFMKPHPSGLRVTIYHALPTTTTLVALKGNQVIGTVSIIRDNPLGMPMESIFDIRTLRDQVWKSGSRIAEISSLAIHPDYRKSQGEVLFPLLKFMHEYCRGCFQIDRLLIAVNPKHIDLYEGSMLFKRLNAKVIKSYDFVNGAPAVGATLDLTTAHNDLLSVYGNFPIERSFFAYFMLAKSFQTFLFPDRSYFKVSDPVMTPELLKYFFWDKTEVFEKLNIRQKSVVLSQYQDYRAYVEVLPKVELSNLPEFKWSREMRFDVACDGVIGAKESSRLVPIKITRVSLTGFRAELKESLELSGTALAKVRIANHESISLEVEPVWSDGARVYGFKIPNPNQRWKNFINYLKADREKFDEIRTGGSVG